uniref:ATP synthase complex subunit 8 n=1 Tax=Cantharis pellucida TaxID=877753 RepID=E3VTB0_9COLE|nr:ATP synthase F0 subunit 8 [Cantharis pellucida]
MPQMAPLSWLNLFIYFIIIFMIYNSLNYFYFNKPSISQDSKNISNKNKTNWKW